MEEIIVVMGKVFLGELLIWYLVRKGFNIVVIIGFFLDIVFWF